MGPWYGETFIICFWQDMIRKLPGAQRRGHSELLIPWREFESRTIAPDTWARSPNAVCQCELQRLPGPMIIFIPIAPLFQTLFLQLSISQLCIAVWRMEKTCAITDPINWWRKPPNTLCSLEVDGDTTEPRKRASSLCPIFSGAFNFPAPSG